MTTLERATSSHTHLLIADDDATMARALSRAFTAARPVSVVSSVAEAVALLSVPGHWCGAIIDHNFPDGVGLTVLEAFRRRAQSAPVLMLTGSREPDVINKANALGAHYAVKPVPSESLRAFAARLDEDRVEGGADAALRSTLLDVAGESALSPAELRLLDLAVHGVAREEIADRLGVAESTVKSHVRTLIAKCGVLDLAAATRLVWKRASRA